MITKSDAAFLQSGFDFEGRDILFQGDPEEITRKIIESAGWNDAYNKYRSLSKKVEC